MKVLNIGTTELGIIEDSLEYYESVCEAWVKNEKDTQVKEEAIHMSSQVRQTRKLLQDQGLQELCEKCLSYFWDRLSTEGVCNPDVEWLSEEMILTEQELMELFKEAGFEE